MPHPSMPDTESAPLGAVADPVRLRLVSLIASSTTGEACVCDLNDAFDLMHEGKSIRTVIHF